MDSDLDPSIPRTAHLVGICGSGMKALAEYLHDRGWRLSGSDRAAPAGVVNALAQRGIAVNKGHRPERLPSDAELLIYSPAVGDEDPERVRAAELQIPQLSYVDFAAGLTRQQPTICIAGTHGKSTTTAMVGSILRSAGWDPSVICGAESIADGTSGRGGKGEWLVLESCEYRGHFLKYQPAVAVVTGMEPDHFDCFPDGNSEQVFVEFMSNVPRGGTVVADVDGAPEYLAPCRAELVRFISPMRASFDQPSDSVRSGWSVTSLMSSGTGIRFCVLRKGEPYGDIHLQVPGEHNVHNALAAIASCDALGLTPRQIFKGLADFRGLKRRFEVRNQLRATFIDDYAHHPTAIRLLLKTARKLFPGRKLRCAFQPHQLSRMRMLLHEFADSFDLADEVFVLPVFPAREQLTEEHRTASQALVRMLNQAGKTATQGEHSEFGRPSGSPLSSGRGGGGEGSSPKSGPPWATPHPPFGHLLPREKDKLSREKETSSTAGNKQSRSGSCERATSVDDLDHLARTLETSVTSEDVVLTIGAGDIDRLYHEFA